VVLLVGRERSAGSAERPSSRAAGLGLGRVPRAALLLDALVLDALLLGALLLDALLLDALLFDARLPAA